MWRLRAEEFWSNKIKPLRRDMDELVVPIVKKAIERKRKGEKAEKADGEGIFLDNLVQHTEGVCLDLSCVLSELIFSCTDEKILTDELVNILVAGRDTVIFQLAYSSG